jgi:hypothetical protein
MLMSFSLFQCSEMVKYILTLTSHVQNTQLPIIAMVYPTFSIEDLVVSLVHLSTRDSHVTLR